MKKLFNMPGRLLLCGLALSVAALAFTSCTKTGDDYEQPPVAGFMAFNLAPDKPGVGFALSGSRLSNTPLGFTNYTGTYLPVYTGSREVAAFDFNDGSTLATNTFTFEDSSYYSAFLVGVNGYYRNVIVKDDLVPITPVSGKAWVRYINAVADTAARPSITIGGNTSSAVAFGTVSGFEQVNAGDLALAIDGESSFNVNRSITVEENKIYTILFTGQPGQVNPSLAVQIKFIQNGTATH
ncbi:MAG: DUF4397 domain-containing protein [Ferruginibacter sp.]